MDDVNPFNQPKATTAPPHRSGRQPRDLTPEKLLEHSRLPLAWHDQRIVLGFG